MNRGPFNRRGEGKDSVVDPVDIFLADYPQQIQCIILELRRTARRAMAGSHEFLYYDAINYSINDSPHSRICYIRPSLKLVTLGFRFGRQLDDPRHLLQGGGKLARYVRVRTLEGARSTLLEELIRMAWAHGVPSEARKRRQGKKATSPANRHQRPRSRIRSAHGARPARSQSLHSRRR